MRLAPGKDVTSALAWREDTHYCSLGLWGFTHRANLCRQPLYRGLITTGRVPFTRAAGRRRSHSASSLGWGWGVVDKVGHLDNLATREWNTFLPRCRHRASCTWPHCGSRSEFTHCKKGSCSITQLFSRPKVSKSHCVISQEPFLQRGWTLTDWKAVAKSWGTMHFRGQSHTRHVDQWSDISNKLLVKTDWVLLFARWRYSTDSSQLNWSDKRTVVRGQYRHGKRNSAPPWASHRTWPKAKSWKMPRSPSALKQMTILDFYLFPWRG